MIRYIKADLYRIFGRGSRFVTLGAFLGVFAAILWTLADSRTPYEMVEMMTKIMTYICPLFGLVEFGVVIGDDLKAKTMQIAIGTGVSRKKVILAKWFEMIFLTALDMTVFVAITYVIGRIRGVVFDGEPLRDIIILAVFALVQLAGAVMLTFIVVFHTMNSNLGTVAYIVTAFGIFGFICEAVITIGPLDQLHLDSYLFSPLLEAAKARMIIGTVSIPHIAGCAAYLVLFYILACAAFKKVELEF